MQYICELFKVKIGDYDGAAYRQELIANTDYRKFDGALRMVIDVSEESADLIEAFLEAEFEHGRLVYGVWRSNRAIMTCMMFDMSESRHLHLIDGSDGGYAMAAKALKRRQANSVVQI